MHGFKTFLTDDSGAVTVDWVVLTAGLVGLGLAGMAVVSAGVEDLSGDMRGQMEGQTISTRFSSGAGSTWDWSGASTVDYYNASAPLAPGNNGAIYGHAQMLAAQDAPEGFNFTNPLYDPATGNVVYTSENGEYYASGGQIYPVGEYPGEPVYWGA